MPKKCCICQNPFEKGDTFILTDAEKAAIGVNAPKEVSYCLSCLKVMRDPEAGAQLLKGLYEMELQEKGAPRTIARALADRFYKKLKESKKGN
jgi:hypothetical protein